MPYKGVPPVRARALLLTFVVVSMPGAAWARPPSFVEDPADDTDAGYDLEEEAFGTRGLVRTRAGTVSFDAKERSIDLAGDVRIDAPPFHLRSQHIKLARTKWGIEADGDGKLQFCPCLGTPLTIEFSRAIVAPPGELFLKDPKLEVYGVPVAWVPWFWLRSDEKPGVLPPDLAYRGHDGFFAGDGFHLPWKERGARESLDVRAGGYFVGGVALDARLETPQGNTSVHYDRLRSQDGLGVDARGAVTSSGATVAWDADLLRGRRAVLATSDLDAAAKPWDRATGAASMRFGPITAESGYRVVTRRGGDLSQVDASGPFVALRSSGAALSAVAWDATAEGGALQTPGDTVSFARAELGALAARNFGPIAGSLSARGAGDIVNETLRSGTDIAASARARFGLPIARSYVDAERNDPLIHTMEPFVETAILHADGDALLGVLPGRGMATVHGTAPITDAGFTTTVGRWAAREAITIGGSAGLASMDHDASTALVRARAAATTPILGLDAESGHTKVGSAIAARLRFGREERLRLLANIAARGNVDPVLARALTDAPLEPSAGFLARSGATGGATVVVPWSPAVTMRIGADADATNGELVAVRGGIDLRDRCGCVTLHANAAHRVGREGVDVWLVLDFAPDRTR